MGLTYRPKATLGPLIAWSLLAAFTAWVLLDAAADKYWAPYRWSLVGFAAVLILMGPLSLIAYLIRAFAVRVELTPYGLLLSKRRLLPWSEIRDIARRGWHLASWNSLESLRSGEFGDSRVILVVFVAMIPAWILRTLFLPVLVLFAPCPPRVVLFLKDGTRIVYRDLADSETLVRKVQEALGVRGEA